VSQPFHLRLPATSANLGSAFDAAAIAFDFCLEIEAAPAAAFQIEATGRNVEQCSRLEGNLILDVYRALLERFDRPVIPLAIRMRNEIPLAMGCGSSAAGYLAAIALASHFGGLGWSSEQILEEACALEGHPDNAAACWLGGFVTAAMQGRAIYRVQVPPPEHWRALLAIPADPLATSKARALLPEQYLRADAVANIQAASLLGLAFAQGRGDLLRVAMVDRIHQPFRAAVCPLLPRLLPLMGEQGILGVSLSGAGPSVLLIIDGEDSMDAAQEAVRQAVAPLAAELLICRFAGPICR